MINWENTTKAGNESDNSSNNNVYQDKFEKVVSNDNYANGMGIARPASLKSFEEVPGSEANEQYMMKMREIDRFNSIKKAFGNPEINNAGIVLDLFGGSLGEGRQAPSSARGTGKEQSR